MNSLAHVYRRLPWINLPVGVLVALLQRTPVVKMATAASEYVVASPVGQVLRAAFTAAALGAMHSRAGATTYNQSPANPVRGTVGSPIGVAFGFTGAPSDAQHWVVISGQLPPGTTFVPAASADTIRARDVGIAGTPTQGGSYSVTLQAIGLAGQSPLVEIVFEITGGSAATAPSITTQPQSQTVAAGGSATFTVAAGGSTPLTYQWRKDGVNLGGATNATLSLSNVQAGQAGSYSVVVTNSAGSATSASATLTVSGGTGGGAAPVIVSQPTAQSIGAGSTVVFDVGVTGATSYQWRRNGSNLSGETNSTLVIRSTTAAHSGSYSVVASNSSSSVTSDVAALTVNSSSDMIRLINLSILTDITAADPFFTLGTVIGGAGTAGAKPLLIRAAGPALSQLGVGSPLADPRLELFSNQAVTASNDDWGGSTTMTEAFSRVGAFPFQAVNSKDAAVFSAATAAGDYTVRVSGVGDAAGPVIAELYDASASTSVSASTPRLVNVSVLKQIPSGTILTAGFVIGGGTTGAKTVLIRAVGPTLGAAPFNVPGAMANPTLTLYRGQTVIATNDDWGGNSQHTAVGTSVGAFAITDTTSRDAIILVTLPIGNYTAQVSGVAGGGLALVEVYEVP